MQATTTTLSTAKTPETLGTIEETAIRTAATAEIQY
jgi:hypothetical protein